MITRLGLGTAPLGGLFRAVDEADALQVVDGAWQEGLRFFDTAPLYGFGLAERHLGRILREKARADYTFATKVGRLLRPMRRPSPARCSTAPRRSIQCSISPMTA